MIIVEGSDNSGKSTLVDALAQSLPTWHVQRSEGPPKHQGEMHERLARYWQKLPITTIYDRHPVFSQGVYCRLRAGLDEPTAVELLRVMASRPLIIMCRGPMEKMLSLEGHQVKGHDSPEHLEALKRNVATIVQAYEEIEMWLIMMGAHVLAYEYHRMPPTHIIHEALVRHAKISDFPA